MSNNSFWQPDELIVGWDGNGFLELKDNAELQAITLTVGKSANRHGEIVIRNDAKLNITGIFSNVGDHGIGVVSIVDDAKVGTGFRLGTKSDGSGTLIIDDATLHGSVTAGLVGYGEVFVQNGGKITGGMKVGDSSSFSASGKVTIDGFASSWTVPSVAVLGDLGDAEINITNQGRLISAGAVMGSSISSQTEVTVSGLGSNWTDSGSIFVGVSGTDLLRIEDRATFQPTDVVIGLLGTVQTDGGTIFGGDIEIRSGGTLHAMGSSGAIFAATLINEGSFILDDNRMARVSDVYLDQNRGPLGNGWLIIDGVGDFRNSISTASFGGNLSFGTDTHLDVSFATNTADRLVVADNVLVGGNLHLNFDDLAELDESDSFVIVEVGGNVLSNFECLGEGDQVLHNGEVGLFITYQGGDGNDIELFAGPANIESFIDEFTIVRGRLNSGDLSDLAESDDNYFSMNPGITLDNTEPPVWLEFNGMSSVLVPEYLEFRYESAANTPGLLEVVELWNPNDKQFEVIASQPAQTTDQLNKIQLDGDLSRFVESDRSMKARMSWKRNGLLFVFPWAINIDQALWFVGGSEE